MSFGACETIIIDTGTTLAKRVSGRIEICATDGGTVVAGEGGTVHTLLRSGGIPPSTLANTRSQNTGIVAPATPHGRTATSCEILTACTRAEGKQTKQDG